MDVSKAIATTIKTGKISLGIGNSVTSAKIGRAKLVILASNCPRHAKDDIEHYSGLSAIPVVIYSGTSLDLGAACRKPFPVSALAIRDPGDSDILKLAKTRNPTAHTKAVEAVDA